MKYMIYNITNPRSCQTEFCDMEVLSHTVESFNEKERLAFNVFLRISNKHTHIFPKQATIGGFSDYSRETINRKVKKWVEIGLLRKVTIYHKYCIYILHPAFYAHEFRQKYSHLFDAFKTIALIFLFSFGLKDLYGDVTLKNPDIKNLYLLSPYGTYGNTLTVSNLTICKRDSKKVWNMYANEARKKLILELTQRLGLTKRGQVALAPFPAECLEYGLGVLNTANIPRVRNVWGWFISLCNEWCKTNDIRPDFKTENDLIRELNLNQNSPKIATTTEEFHKREVQKRSVPKTPVKEWQREEVKPFDMREYLANQKKEAQKIREEGNSEWADKLECEITKERPAQYAMALSVARSAPNHVKDDWIAMLNGPDADLISEPVRQALKEYQEGQNIPVEPTIFSELAEKSTAYHKAQTIALDNMDAMLAGVSKPPT